MTDENLDELFEPNESSRNKNEIENTQATNTDDDSSVVAGFLGIVGWSLIVIGLINLFFMAPIWGICTREYIGCDSIDEFANSGMIIGLGVGGFLTAVISASVFFGLSKIIKVLESIRDKN